MAIPTIDTDKAYILVNASAGRDKLLAISIFDNYSLLLEPASAAGSARNQQWLLTPTIHRSCYRLHGVSEGISLALDVLNNADTHSTDLRMHVLGDNSGQYWRVDSWAGGP